MNLPFAIALTSQNICFNIRCGKCTRGSKDMQDKTRHYKFVSFLGMRGEVSGPVRARESSIDASANLK